MCELIRWVLAYVFLVFVGALIYKVALHRHHHGSVTTWGVATDQHFWFENDRRFLAAALLFPFLFWSIVALFRFVICTSTRFALVGAFSGVRYTGRAIGSAMQSSPLPKTRYDGIVA